MNINDFMNNFLDAPMPNVDSEYIEIEQKYKNTFGHIVPREMLPPSISTTDIKAAMIDSISKGQDSVFEYLGIEINPNYIY